MKNIVICFDGTWNTSDSPYPTNVVRTAQMVAPRDCRGVEQVVFYDAGVGAGEVTVGKSLDSLLGGAFGHGLLANIENAYRFLIFNYAPGDQIFVFGFSRGAFSARSFGGLIRNCGILSKENVRMVPEAIDLYKNRDRELGPTAPKAVEFREKYGAAGCAIETNTDRRAKANGTSTESRPPITIHYLGIWDTVGALGVPKHLFGAEDLNLKYEFHDAELSSLVRGARHALAIDEERRIFDATPWSNLKKLNQDAMELDPTVKEPPYAQQWFPGDHGSVGGGGDNPGLWQAALVWIVEGAKARGLEVDQAKLDAYRKEIDYKTSVYCMKNPDFSITSFATRSPRAGPAEDDDVTALSEWAIKRYKEDEKYRPQTLSAFATRFAELVGGK